MPEFATSIEIEAPPEVVFAHLVTPERMVSWMGQHAELDPVPGGGFAVDINGTLVRGEYLEVDPPHRVVVSWGMAGTEDLPPGSSRVEFRLTRTTAGTTLELLHTGLPDTRTSGHAHGWTHYLDRLRTALHGIDPGPDTWSPTGERAMNSSTAAAKRAARTAELVGAYYDSWKRGAGSFDEDRLRGLLAPDLDFEGPIAGKRSGAEPFLQGLARFVSAITALHPLQQIDGEGEASALYDCDLPGGRVRFAEFFRVSEDRIQAIRLLYDAAEFRRCGGG